MGEINKLAEKINAPVIPCDVSNGDDVENLITKTMEHFGGSFDFILHSIFLIIHCIQSIYQNYINNFV